MNFIDPSFKIAEKKSDYFSLADGDSKLIRVIKPTGSTHAALGARKYWTNENKPVLSLHEPIDTPDIKVTDDGKQTRPQQILIMIVWNQTDELIQIREIPQVSIQQRLLELRDNDQWGDPTDLTSGYSMTISRSGKGLQTRYSIDPAPKTIGQEIPEHIQHAVDSIDLVAYAEGDTKTAFDAFDQI